MHSRSDGALVFAHNPPPPPPPPPTPPPVSRCSAELASNHALRTVLLQWLARRSVLRAYELDLLARHDQAREELVRLGFPSDTGEEEWGVLRITHSAITPAGVRMPSSAREESRG